MINRRRAARLTRLAHFDMEHLVSSVLRNGMVLCVSLAVAGFIIQQVLGHRAHLARVFQASSVSRLLLTDFQQTHAPDFWPDLLIDATVAVLILIPYLRVLTSMLYLSLIERDRKLTLLTSFVLIVATIVVLTDLV